VISSCRLVLSAAKPNDIRRPLGFSRNKPGISPTYRASRDVFDWAPACAGATVISSCRLVLSAAKPNDSCRLVLSAANPNDIRCPLGFSRNKSGISPTYRASRDVFDWAPACAGATVISSCRWVLSAANPQRHSTPVGLLPEQVQDQPNLPELKQNPARKRRAFLCAHENSGVCVVKFGPRPAPGRRHSMGNVMPAKAGIQ